jgi:hypothetical protein
MAKQAKTSTSFPTMGTSASRARVMADSAPSLKFVPRKGAKSGAAVGTKGTRKGQQERLGFKGAPQVTMAYPNNPESSQEFRNVRLVPSAVGNRDFYLKRAYGQTGNFG